MNGAETWNDATASRVGFIGLGTMGEPMAMNLVKAGTSLLVWNRSPSTCQAFVKAGAEAAATPREVFERCFVVILMLVDAAVTDVVLGRDGAAFGVPLRGRSVINMATHAPCYSRQLEADVRAAGGSYIEAPVSGSRVPAERGRLVAMLAGDPVAVRAVRSLLAPMCLTDVVCGPVPSALRMKLAVNVFLIAMVTGLVEAVHFAHSLEIETSLFVSVLDAGPMASDVSRDKGAKLVARDFTTAASISNVLENSRLVAEAARDANIASPLLDVCHALFRETEGLGLGREDMAAVIRAYEERTAALA